MVRIAGVNIPDNKRIEISLTYIFGVGPSTSRKILTSLGINPDTRTKDLLTEDANTLTRWADQLGKLNSCSVAPVLLKDGFRPDELVEPDQKTLGI